IQPTVLDYLLRLFQTLTITIMFVRLYLLISLALCLALPIGAQEQPLAEATQTVLPSPAESAAELTYRDVVVLGLVEGATEFLPVSSTGHLILTSELLGLNQEIPLLSPNGKEIKLKADIDGNAYPLTLKTAVDNYSIVIQIGAIFAVVIVFRQRVTSLFWGVLGKDPQGFLLFRNIVVAFMPAVIFGLLLASLIDDYLFGPIPVLVALVGGGILMLLVEKVNKPKDSEIDLHELTIKQSLLIGLMQCIAMWPGTSRSMITMVGGYMVGLSARRAAEFSFLLGLPTLSAASLYKGYKMGPAMIEAVGFGKLAVGCLVATVTAA